MAHFQVLIIGSGDDGISTATKILRRQKEFQIAIIEPTGLRPDLTEATHGVRSIKEVAAFFEPYKNKLITAQGNLYSYDYLIIQSLTRKSNFFMRQSLLVDKNGSVDVYKKTLQHKKYQNIFALTDSINVSNDNKDALTKKQTPILVKKLFEVVKHDLATGRCPKKKILSVDNADLIHPDLMSYDHIMGMSQFNNENPGETMLLWKKQNLPWFYHHKMQKGLA